MAPILCAKITQRLQNAPFSCARVLAQERNEPRSAQAEEKRTEQRPTGEGVSTRNAILHQSDQPDHTNFKDAKAESEQSHVSSSDVFFFKTALT